MKTIKLNKKQREIIDPMSQKIIGLRSTLSDLAIFRGTADSELFEAINELFPEFSKGHYSYNHKDKTLEITEEK